MQAAELVLLEDEHLRHEDLDEQPAFEPPQRVDAVNVRSRIAPITISDPEITDEMTEHHSANPWMPVPSSAKQHGTQHLQPRP